MSKPFVAAVAALLVMALAPAALAEAPADVDCGVLETTLIGIDDAIDLSSGGAPAS